jgi:hypothetical protein
MDRDSPCMAIDRRSVTSVQTRPGDLRPRVSNYQQTSEDIGVVVWSRCGGDHANFVFPWTRSLWHPNPSKAASVLYTNLSSYMGNQDHLCSQLDNLPVLQVLLVDLHSSWPRHQMICYQDPLAVDAMMQDLGERQVYTEVSFARLSHKYKYGSDWT